MKIVAMAEAFKKADPDGTKALALLKGYGNVGSICPLCGGKIKRVVCHKHDEEFEIGHAENCPNRNTAVQIGDDCVIEQID